MSQKELGRLRVLEQVLQGAVSHAEAAAVLQISVRQLRRIERRYEANGERGLVHGLRGQASNRKLDVDLVRYAQQLIATHYADFGPTLAAEMLAERHSVVLSVESVRTLMRQAGLWRARSWRLKPIHPLRQRRPQRGELIQIDGSLHDWFEGRGPRCTLLVFIDDATSELMTLHFAPAETTTDYLKTLRGYILAHGLPMCLYSDRHSIFRSSNQDNPRPTQFEQAVSRLGIEAIQASSPQAKGRVERANQTLQNRLVKAMRLAQIDDIDAANHWIESYLPLHNQRFACAPAQPDDAHVPYLGSPAQLDDIMAYRHQRRLSRTLSCQFRKQVLQIEAPGQQRRLAGQYITLIVRLDGQLSVLHNGQPLPYQSCEKSMAQKPAVAAKELNDNVQAVINKRPKPPLSHPWKAWQGSTPNPNLHLRNTP